MPPGEAKTLPEANPEGPHVFNSIDHIAESVQNSSGRQCNAALKGTSFYVLISCPLNHIVPARATINLMTASENEAKQEVEAYFNSLDSRLETSNPGILNLLEVYGDYEAALQQADIYLQTVAPKPRFFTTDGSNS